MPCTRASRRGPASRTFWLRLRQRCFRHAVALSGTMIRMDAMPTRPWYRLHWETCASTLVVAGILLWSQVSPTFRFIGNLEGSWSAMYCGWPYAWLVRTTYEDYDVSSFLGAPTSVTTTTLYQWHPWRLVFSVALTVVLIASVAAMVERWRRAWSGRPQFTLRSLLTLTFVAGVLILLHDRSVLTRGVARLAWFEEALVLFALGCGLFLVASRIPPAGVWLLARLRPAPSHDRADGGIG